MLRMQQVLIFVSKKTNYFRDLLPSLLVSLAPPIIRSLGFFRYLFLLSVQSFPILISLESNFSQQRKGTVCKALGNTSPNRFQLNPAPDSIRHHQKTKIKSNFMGLVFIQELDLASVYKHPLLPWPLFRDGESPAILNSLFKIFRKRKENNP